MDDAADVFDQQWYPVVNDLIGGWAVSTIDLPLSQNDRRTRAVVADYMDEPTAKRLADEHNEQLDQSRFMRFTGTKLSPIVCPELEQDETLASRAWQDRWIDQLRDVVQYEDPWGLVGMRPDGDYHLFGADESGIRLTVRYGSVRVWMLFPEWKL